MGPEYPGEGAMDNILIAGSTDIKDLRKQSLFASRGKICTFSSGPNQRPAEMKLPQLIYSPLVSVKEMLKQTS